MKISLNKQVFSFLLENEKKLSEFEEYLLGKIPWAFVNFLGLDNALIEIIFKTQSSFIKSKLDYSNTNITQAIQNFVQVANYIQSQFDIAQDIKLNFLETFESSFLFAMFLAQNLRVTLLQPQYSAFQFEKILSVAEKKVFKSSKNQFREEDMPAFQLSENILTDDFGQVDIQKTKELEEQKNEIKIFFSSFDSVFHQTKYLKVNMQNRSKHIVFAMLNPKLCETICSACSSIIVEKYAKSVYHQLKTNPNLEEVTQKTQNYLKETALAYIRRTQNIQDPFKLKEYIKKTTLLKY